MAMGEDVAMAAFIEVYMASGRPCSYSDFAFLRILKNYTMGKSLN